MNRTGRTNQVLYFARLSLDMSDHADTLQLKQMYEENALQHLYSAFVCLLSELVDQYRLPSVTGVDEVFSRPDLPGELLELKIASEDSNLWVNQLIKQYQRLLLKGLHNNVQSGLISNQSDYGELFRNYLKELEIFVQRMRDQYQEN